MLGREVVEREQLLGVVGDLGHGLGPLDPVVTHQRRAIAWVACSRSGASRISANALRAPACTALGRQPSTLAACRVKGWRGGGCSVSSPSPSNRA